MTDPMRPSKADLAAATADLARLVAHPSVSARGVGMEACAKDVAALLSDAGFATEIIPGKIAPYVVGENGSGEHTIIIYNHYDVQPEEPLDLWTSPPFTLTERNGKLFGRGAADDKGEFVSRLAGWHLFRKHNPGPLPFRLLWIVDGEEEIGSPSLQEFLATRFAGRKAEAIWWEYGEIDSSGAPVILLGFKGVIAMELRCRTARADLHSSLGALFDNPLWRLASAVSSLRDNTGKVLIDGFYDTVRAPEPETLAAVAAPPFTLASVKAATGAERVLTGTTEETVFERLSLAPCINVNGFHGGYGGKGSKTVLPSEGFAKLDFRIVPDQSPDRIVALLRAHLDRLGFTDIEMIVDDAEVRPVRCDSAHWAVQLAAPLLEKWFGRPAILQPSSPASGTAHPFVSHFGAPVIGIGLTHHGAMLHSPDENILIDQFERMIGFSAAYLAALKTRFTASR